MTTTELSDSVADACLAVLSPSELERHAGFRAAAAQQQFLVGRWLARTVLSRYAPVAPGDWEFDSGPHGRPEIGGRETASRLRFNLSHTRDLAVCVVCLEADCGVDVESPGRELAIGKLARRYLAASEIAALERAEGEERRQLFYAFWTLKEAYLKARGIGISVPLRHASFALGGETVTVVLEPELDDRAEEWQLALFRPSAAHVLSVAVRRGDGDDLPIVARRMAMPGGRGEDLDLVPVAVTQRRARVSR